MGPVEIGKFVLEILLKIGPDLYEFIKDQIDGGASAAKLRGERLEVSIAFGGGPGKVIVVQEAIEDEMADPKAT